MENQITFSRKSDGKTFVGWRVVTEEARGSERVRRQTIHFEGHHDADSGKYRIGQDDYMNEMAKLILRQLVERVESMRAAKEGHSDNP